ncbi:hypothetical protein HGO23_11415 [Xenorhabdus budapestensis]|uniref:Uncharacterized protein n=1 Tax=Xenorhabdus budapestensis TaxID=290110 RepID=A0ABX7VCD2_XENBU|nr:hypothetical protein [Xenorhabdus budapestensis]QTL38516.1 hypothetical protein HGO23_11415 [Xenorhabdus budapestensis]
MRNTLPTPVELNKGRIKYGVFLVRPLPKNVLRPLSRYQVEEGDCSHGLFDSRNEAVRYCQQLYRIRIHERIKAGAA